MRWSVRILLFVIILLVAYGAWPLFGLKKIAEAVDARNAPALSALLDVQELKSSLIEQVVHTFLKVSGENQGSGSLTFNESAVRLGMAIADPLVAKMMNAEALIDLLKQSHIEILAGSHISVDIWGLPNLRNALKLFLNFEYRGPNFYVTIPLFADAKEGYRLRLKLSQWRWKLAGIYLPEEFQIRLARELLKRNAP
jgi:hypothetical protein